VCDVNERQPTSSETVFVDTLYLHCYVIFLQTAPSLSMSSYDLDYGKKNSYIPAELGDGGQGQFGAVSPSNWRVPGTSPIGQQSFSGAADGVDEPWFAEAVSTVSLDLKKAEDTLKAFTKDAATFKIDEFCKTEGIKDSGDALSKLTGAMGYDKFLESTPKQLAKEWEKLSGTTNAKEE
jgi:hypothetical protein